jgi:DNA modification methylase
MIGLVNANALNIPLADGVVQCCVTSPPYWGLRDYQVGGQLGLEQSPDCLGWATGSPCGVCFVCQMVAVFREVRRVLRDDGTLWLNLGDSYATGTTAGRQEGTLNLGGGTNTARQIKRVGTPDGLKTKDLVGIPWRVAFALQADGWYLRSDIIWAKPNPMPESVTDRPTKSHEYLFLLSKSQKYFYDADAVREAQSESTLERFAPGQAPRKANGQKWQKVDALVKPEEVSGPIGILASGRNRRTVWNIATAPYAGSHFATYPPALVEPCIKAGTPERGRCPSCGKGWVRVVETDRTQANRRYRDWREVGWETDENGKAKSTGNPIQCTNPRAPKVTTLGFTPACDCPAHEPVPAIVLDPFAGSGTTLLVARQLGRSAVGLDLSLAYLTEQARVRLGLDALDAWTDGAKPTSNDGYHELPLFAGGV